MSEKRVGVPGMQRELQAETRELFISGCQVGQRSGRRPHTPVLQATVWVGDLPWDLEPRRFCSKPCFLGYGPSSVTILQGYF